MNKKKIIIAAAVVIIAAAAIAAAILNSSAPDKKNSDEAPAVSQSAAPAEKSTEEAGAEKAPESSEAAAAPEKTNAPAGAEKSPKETAEPEVKVAPTFMYFVNDDLEKETAGMIEELKKEYQDVVFDIKNVDKDPELLKNFALVDGKLPSLIMLDTSNNICGFEFMCSDKSKLEENIKKALGN